MNRSYLAFIVVHGINPARLIIFFQRNGVHIFIYVGDYPLLIIARDVDPLFIMPNEVTASRLRGNLVGTVLPTDDFLQVEGCFLAIDHNVERIGILLKANADAAGRYIVLALTESFYPLNRCFDEAAYPHQYPIRSPRYCPLLDGRNA